MGLWGVSVETARLVRKVSPIRFDIRIGPTYNRPHRDARLLEGHVSLDEDEDDIAQVRRDLDFLSPFCADYSKNSFLGMSLPPCVVSVFH